MTVTFNANLENLNENKNLIKGFLFNKIKLFNFFLMAVIHVSGEVKFLFTVV